MKESAPFRLGYVFLTPPEPKAVEVCPVNGSILRGNCRNFRLARKVKAGLRRFKTQITPDNSLENPDGRARGRGDRKSTRLNSSHSSISYAVFCLKKKKEY